MLKVKIALLLLLFYFYSGSIYCANPNFNSHGVEIPKKSVLEETGDVLNLQGAARHKRYFQDYYLGAFYSRKMLENPHQVLEDEGPKRMWFYYLHDTNQVRADWEQAIIENNSPELVQRDQIQISQFLKMVDLPIKKGDVIMLDYIPNVGTKVTVRGSVRGIVKGNEFYNELLKTWMGRQPPSEKFRKDLFNFV